MSLQVQLQLQLQLPLQKQPQLLFPQPQLFRQPDQLQLLPLVQPQLVPLFHPQPQQQKRTMMRMIHRQESLFPLLKLMMNTSL